MICKQCDKEFFKPKQPKAIYCSKQCCNEAQKKTVIKSCATCGKDFSVNPSAVKNNRGKYCSIACRGLGSGKKLTRDVEKICTHCRNRFNDKPAGKKRFCTRKCYLDSGGRPKIKTLHNFICLFCGATFNDSPSKNRRFCGNECRIAHQKASAGYTTPKRPRHVYKSLVNRYKECFRCGHDDAKIHLHHIDGVHDNDRESNLMPLCTGCHRKLHALYDAATISLEVFTHSFVRNK